MKISNCGTNRRLETDSIHRNAVDDSDLPIFFGTREKKRLGMEKLKAIEKLRAAYLEEQERDLTAYRVRRSNIKEACPFEQLSKECDNLLTHQTMRYEKYKAYFKRLKQLQKC